MNLRPDFNRKRKGQAIGINDIGPIALAIGVAIMIVAVVALILAQFVPVTRVATGVTGETQNSTGSTPETITADNLGGGLVSGSDSISIFDSELGTTTTLTRGTNYTVLSLTAGTFNMTSVTAVNTTTDQYNLNYTYNADTNTTTVVVSGLAAIVIFSDFFGVIVIVAVSVIILALVLLLSRFQGAGGRD